LPSFIILLSIISIIDRGFIALSKTTLTRTRESDTETVFGKPEPKSQKKSTSKFSENGRKLIETTS
jgi:hypothetical protein